MSPKTAARKRGASTRAKAQAPEAPDLPRAFHPVLAATIVFIAAGAVLVLEILAVRLLAPYVGLTLETTTAIIGAALGGIGAGAAIGGYLADRTDTRRLIVLLLLLGGILTLLIVPVIRWLGPGAQGSGELTALGITFVALVPAATVLSAVSPAVAHLQLHDLRASGTIVGRLSAWATAGALVGTFGTGFVLVPLMPVSTAVLAIAVVLLGTGILLGAIPKIIPPAIVAAVALGALALGAGSASMNSPCLTETHYHCIRIVRDPEKPGGYNLLLDDGYESFVAKDPKHLVYPYTRWIADAVNGMSPSPAPLDGVFIGGGGLTLPRWLEATRPGSRSEVLEVDGDMIDFIENRLDLHESPRFKVLVGDARINMLKVPSDSADLVVGDAFSNHSVPWHLTTTEWMEEVKRVLKRGGIYAMNVIDARPLDMLKAEAATLLGVFRDVRLVDTVGEDGRPFGGNAVLLASGRPMAPAVRSSAFNAITYNLAGVEWLAKGAEPLRDDYAPVDQLITRTN